MPRIDARQTMQAILLWPFTQRPGDLIDVFDSDSDTSFPARIVRFNADSTLLVRISRNREFVCQFRYSYSNREECYSVPQNYSR